MTENACIRIDKWLWFTRIYKTRSMASNACNAGKIKINGNSIKSSKDVKKGDVIHINVGIIIKIVEVIDIPKNRIGPKLVVDFLKDITPQSEYDKLRLQQEANKNLRPKGLGRPTKKERREFEKWDF